MKWVLEILLEVTVHYLFLFMLSLDVFDEVGTGDTSRSYCPIFLFILSLFVEG